MFAKLLRGFALAIGLIVVLAAREGYARVRLENICTIYGQKEVKLTGIGMVVGLAGTGDGGKSAPTIRGLASMLKLMNQTVSAGDLRNAKNVALVLVEATIPKTGLRRGQRIDCYVSSILGTSSLRGGRLFITPLETAEIGDDKVVALASGPIHIEDLENPTSTTGIILGGVILEEDFVSHFIDRQRGDVVTLAIDREHSGFTTAAEIAQIVNNEVSQIVNSGVAGGEGQNVIGRIGTTTWATAISPNAVEVKVPEVYRKFPVDFIADLLHIGIENPHSQAKVVVNAKSGTIIVTGEVEIAPVVVAHRNLTVEVGAAAGGGSGGVGRFVDLSNKQAGASPRHLKDLLLLLNQLRVPNDDIIGIIRALHRTGKLHAVYEEH